MGSGQLTSDLALKDLEALNPDALLLEPREVYDSAVVGVTDSPDDDWPREIGVYVAIYDANKCIEAFMAWMNCDYEQAAEWFSFNTCGAWVGPGTPTFSFVE